MSFTDPNLWYRDAACADDDVNKAAFHDPEAYAIKYAKSVCQGCPVKEPCLQYALDEEGIWGIWGGQTDKERLRLRRRAGAAA